MAEPLFIETIKIQDGKFIRPEYHLERMKQAQQEVFCNYSPVTDLKDEMIPGNYRQGKIKCRMVYGKEIRQTNFDLYHPRAIHSLKLVEACNIDYHLKYADRYALSQLLALRGSCDDILITQNGKITDTSYSNVVCYDGKDYHTPSSYLLNGTKRRFLLQQKKIKETSITIDDLPKFKSIFLINAMLDIEDSIKIEINDIH